MSETVKCQACGGHGYWCRGCGGYMKRTAMEAAGMSKEEVDEVYEDQFAGCDAPYVPCYLCNRYDTRGVSDIPDFWTN